MRLLQHRSPLAVLAAVAARPRAAVKVVATTEDLAALAREVGGDRVKVESIARGYQDPHFVEAKPSFILKLARPTCWSSSAASWRSGGCRRSSSRAATRRSSRAPRLSRRLADRADPRDPDRQVTRAMGDVHPLGNPHYWLDPGNGRRIAAGHRGRSSRSSTRRTPPYFAARYADFDKRLAEAEKRWDAPMAPYKGLKVVTYHRSWPNFAERFGLDVVGYVEPKPGIPPSPGHTLELIAGDEAAERQDHPGRALLRPRRRPTRSAARPARKVLVMPPSVGGEKEITDYIKLFDYDIKLLVSAHQGDGRRAS